MVPASVLPCDSDPSQPRPMKSRRAFCKRPLRRSCPLLLALCAAVGALAAADTNAPPATTASTNAPPATVKDTNAPPASTPDTNAPPATAADTNAPAATAADTNAAPAMTPEQMFEGGTNSYNNWIDFTLGRAYVKRQPRPIPAAAAHPRRRLRWHQRFPFPNRHRHQHHHDPGRARDTGQPRLPA